MIRWLRTTLPSLGWLAFFWLLFSAFAGTTLSLELWIGEVIPDFRRIPSLILVFGATAYGAARVVMFHPFYREGYREWLETTPWTSRRPLPMGPVHLVPQDVLLVGLAALLTWPTCGDWSIWASQCFLLAYLLTLAVPLFGTGAWPIAYAVCFGVGLTVRLWFEPVLSLGAALATYALAFVGLHRSLARFPWNLESLRAWKEIFKEGRSFHGTKELGWPFGQLGPQAAGDEYHVPTHHALGVSVLAAWWFYVSLHGLLALGEARAARPEDAAAVAVFLASPIALVAPAGRLLIYVMGYVPPISLLGRLVTGRWIIPGYDQVFVAPVLAMSLGSTLFFVGTWLDLQPTLYAPLAVLTSSVVTLGFGPTLSSWRLTGNHRIVRGMTRAEGAVKVG